MECCGKSNLILAKNTYEIISFATNQILPGTRKLTNKHITLIKSKICAMMKFSSPAALFAILLALPFHASAHRPLTTGPSCGKDFSSSQTAAKIPNASISWFFTHYNDCSSRALWISFTNPSSTHDFGFYVGVGIPTVDRFQDVRANALIIGPGLPLLSDENFASLPEEVQNDPVWNEAPNIGAYFHISPDDQSTCNHLSDHLQEQTTVIDGRCTFFEPFSQTYSWRVLDVDDNLIPASSAQPEQKYYVAVFMQDDYTAKFDVALGTWDEDFRTPFDIDNPTCKRDFHEDFYEKNNNQAECFPSVVCSSIEGAVEVCLADHDDDHDDDHDHGDHDPASDGDGVPPVSAEENRDSTSGASSIFLFRFSSALFLASIMLGFSA